MIKKTSYGYTIEKKEQFLDVVFYADNIVRFVYSKDEKLPSSTPAVIAKPEEISVELSSNIIKTDKMKIVLDEDTLKVSIYDLEGNLINQDISVNPDDIKIEKKLIWEKGFYGLGEKYGWINKMGTSTVNWNTDVLAVTPLHNPMLKEYHTAINFYLGLDREKSYGIYFDNSYKTTFNFGEEQGNMISFGAEGGNLDYYFIYGNKISEVVEGYSLLTGTMPLPRRDFLGYQQCRWSYENRHELMEIAKKMRQENIPCDILYLDIDYMKDYKVFTVDPVKFKDFKAMIKELREMGYKLVVIIDPGIKEEKGYIVYDEGVENNYFVRDTKGEIYVGQVWPGDSVFPDFLRTEIRQWWGELHRGLIEDGVEGIWNDMNEPADASNDRKTLPEDCIHIDDTGKKRNHGEIHNLYAMLEAEGTYNGLRKIQPNKRPFVLTRAAFAGTQRYAALWTGDNASIWEHMESSIPMFLNLGLSGYSFIGSDVGGFTGDSNGELLSRWTQLGAFTPLFRNHSMKGTINQEPWCFGEESLFITKKYIELRYKLITHLYNLTRESSTTGAPVMRPLFYHYQQDENTYNINDQFLFGEHIMVCPILRPGLTSRMVYLPKGTWYDFWTNEKIEGEKYIIKDAPIDILPIYVKAGTILPIDEVSSFISDTVKTIEVQCYLGAEGKYLLYTDDGVTFDYEDGKYSEVEIIMTESNGEINIDLKPLYTGYQIPEISLTVIGHEGKTIIVNKEIKSKDEPIKVSL